LSVHHPAASGERRVGLGYDIHRFAEGRELVLGGVRIPDHAGLEGHSDADVLAHAISDALLGAAGQGDIGRHFPDTDPSYEGADSISLLAEVTKKLDGLGWRVVNVDATVVCETPRLQPFADEMGRTLAAALRAQPACVSVKATTNEGIGFIGSGEGAAAIAVAQIVRDQLN
jgi:2-C-methyl-D-erythritol 2,4-cyclodiphosphate synthase